MQQMYSCPNCRAPVAYGQPYCTNCNAVLTWPTPSTQGQYQSSSSQYSNQQQWGQQQQWNQQSQGNQQAGWGYQGQQQQQEEEKPDLLQLIKDNRKTVTIIAGAVVGVIVLIVAVAALGGEVSKLFKTPVISSFDASASSITVGQSANLKWDVSGATSVSISPGIGNVSSSGTRGISPTTTTTYTLEAKNMGGSTSKTKIITVTGVLPSVDSFSFNTPDIIAGQTATLSWAVTGATSVSIEPNIGTVPSSGTKSVTPSSTTTYKLTASNNAGNATGSATINVTASNAPVVTTFSASPASISSGKSATLTWEVIGAKSININQGIGGVASKGSTVVTPVASTTYTLTADSTYSSTTREVTVTVDTSGISPTTKAASTTSPPVINAFSASPNAIMLAENSTLTWSVTGARTITISPQVGTVPAYGSTLVVPTISTTYTLSAVNSLGTVTSTATVSVTKSTEGTAPVINSFTASPASISAGRTSTLTWDIVGATVILIDQGIGIPGSRFAQPVSPTETTAYTLTAINSTGSENRTVTVTVTP
jgi:hypothetical protein